MAAVEVTSKPPPARRWRYGDVHPQTGKVFVQYIKGDWEYWVTTAQWDARKRTRYAGSQIKKPIGPNPSRWHPVKPRLGLPAGFMDENGWIFWRVRYDRVADAWFEHWESPGERRIRLDQQRGRKVGIPDWMTLEIGQIIGGGRIRQMFTQGEDVVLVVRDAERKERRKRVAKMIEQNTMGV